jgi:hypothetical protein
MIIQIKYLGIIKIILYVVIEDHQEDIVIKMIIIVKNQKYINVI